MSILNSNNEKYLIIDVWDCFIKDSQGNIICLDTLTNCDLNMESSPIEIRGGKRSALISKINGSKTLTVNTTYPTFNWDILAMQLSTPIITESGKKYISEICEVSETKTITLKQAPNAGSLKVFGKGTISATLQGTEATLTGTGVVAGDKVKAVYEVNTSAMSEKIKINAKNFPSACSMCLTSLVINASDEPVAYITINLGKIQPSANFSLSVASEIQANENSIEWSVLSEDDGNMGEVILEPYTE